VVIATNPYAYAYSHLYEYDMSHATLRVVHADILLLLGPYVCTCIGIYTDAISTCKVKVGIVLCTFDHTPAVC
jgi:hypothetical protein